MKRLFLLAVCLIMAGCASTRDDSDSPSRMSTQPWNRAESYEGMGPLGFLNTR